LQKIIKLKNPQLISGVFSASHKILILLQARLPLNSVVIFGDKHLAAYRLVEDESEGGDCEDECEISFEDE
jgi:hypothetical protein